MYALGRPHDRKPLARFDAIDMSAEKVADVKATLMNGLVALRRSRVARWKSPYTAMSSLWSHCLKADNLVSNRYANGVPAAMLLKRYKLDPSTQMCARYSMRKIILIPLLLVVACTDSPSEGVKNAKGETPVKYVICSQGEKSCFVAARFKDLDSCQSHKDWADMLCDKQSTPGKMVCAKDLGVSVAVAYCTL